MKVAQWGTYPDLGGSKPGGGRGMKTRLAVPLVLAVLAAGCGRSAPPGQEEEGIARHETPKGEAAIELVIEPREITLGETVTLRLVNRGEVQLLTGLPFGVERWDGERWVRVPEPEGAWPDVGLLLPPGGSTDPQRWPTDGVQAEPGWYRAVKDAESFLDSDPEDLRPDFELEARTRFHVRLLG